MPAEVKICGLSTADTVEAAIAAGASFVGLVFYPKSPRNVSLERAQALADQARGRAKVVALTVDAADTLIDRGVRLERYDGMHQDDKGVYREEGPYIAWFKDRCPKGQEMKAGSIEICRSPSA